MCIYIYIYIRVYLDIYQKYTRAVKILPHDNFGVYAKTIELHGAFAIALRCRNKGSLAQVTSGALPEGA